MAEFTKDRYGVDVMKVEVPINMKFVEGAKACRRTSRPTRASEAMKHSATPRRSRPSRSSIFPPA